MRCGEGGGRVRWEGEWGRIEGGGARDGGVGSGVIEEG